MLRRLYPDAIVASAADAEAFGLNAGSDSNHAVLPQAATHQVSGPGMAGHRQLPAPERASGGRGGPPRSAIPGANAVAATMGRCQAGHGTTR